MQPRSDDELRGIWHELTRRDVAEIDGLIDEILDCDDGALELALATQREQIEPVVAAVRRRASRALRHTHDADAFCRLFGLGSELLAAAPEISDDTQLDRLAGLRLLLDQFRGQAE